MNFAKIKSIKKIESKSNLYDIETKNNHNFFANGVLVHNCNFSFWTDGKEVRVASRSAFVDGTFYNSQEVIDRLELNIIELKNRFYSGADHIAVYGELYGPGIMKGVYYSERKDFRAFEIKIFGAVESSAVERPMTAKLRLAQCNIPQVPYINMYNDIYEALAENNVFPSRVQAMDNENGTGLVKFLEFKEGENQAEGLVIQPLEGALYTGNGARVMIKSKNPKFAEKNKPKGDKEQAPPNLFIPIAELYVNENRLDAVLSKFPEPTQKDFGKIIGAMSKDVIEDMIKDGDLPEDWKKQDEFKIAGKAVSTVVANLLKEKLLPRL